MATAEELGNWATYAEGQVAVVQALLAAEVAKPLQPGDFERRLRDRWAGHLRHRVIAAQAWARFLRAGATALAASQAHPAGALAAPDLPPNMSIPRKPGGISTL